jgi:hypothetical protein
MRSIIDRLPRFVKWPLEPTDNVADGINHDGVFTNLEGKLDSLGASARACNMMLNKMLMKIKWNRTIF